ncbi:MAG TPA: toll/interleukin-1 receptor domain-containing protein, partial [Vicinamibacterales bacterium]|nr:toll/interleukin-1 receptor domain-containing protein [Vicinamibacterales bacterium]
MLKSVFISYRRDDAAGHAGRLSDRLVTRLGAARVFMDVEDIAPGQNFAQAIEGTLAKCDCVIAVIGPRWLEAIKARMAIGEDFVRHEIAAALAAGLTVIPVLVGGARMPSAADLPTELAAFSRCQAVEIRDNRFDDDVTRLVDFVAGGRASRRTLAIAVIAAIALLALGGWFARSRFVAPELALGGKWVAELQKPGQPSFRVRLTLEVENDRLTGLVEYPTGDGPILDGRVDQGRITFHTTHVPQFASEPATIRTEATIDGDTLKVKMTDDFGTATGVAKRTTDGK